MKTKQYLFTSDEILTLREALIEYYQSIKHLKSKTLSIAGQKNLENAKALKDQFKQDCMLIRG